MLVILPEYQKNKSYKEIVNKHFPEIVDILNKRIRRNQAANSLNNISSSMKKLKVNGAKTQTGGRPAAPRKKSK